MGLFFVISLDLWELLGDGYDSINIKDTDFSGIRNYFNDFFAADTSKKIRAVQKARVAVVNI